MKKGKRDITAPQPIKMPIMIGVDPRLEPALRNLGPEGKDIADKALALAQEHATLMNAAVSALLGKYELPEDLEGLKESGHEIMVNVLPPNADGEVVREIILYKQVEKVVVE